MDGVESSDWATWIDLIAVPVSVIDLQGRQIAGNAPYRALFGIAEQPEGEHVSAYMPAEDDAWAAEQRERVRRGEIPEFCSDRAFLRADGSVFNARLIDRPVRNSAGEVVGFVGVIVDTTDAHQARRQREATDAKYASVLDAQLELVCEWAPDGRITYGNRAYRDFFGYEADIVGAELGSLLPEEAMVAHDEIVALANRGRAANRRVERAYDDGRTVEWSDSVLPLPDGSTTIVSVGRDVTRRKEVEAELSRRRDEALETAARRSQFVAVASHELRNPLHAMLGLTELLVTDRAGSTSEELAVSLHHTTRRLCRLVDDLLELSRLEAGGVTIEPEPTDLHRLAREVVELARAGSTHGDQVRFGVVVGADVPVWVSVDGARLGQVLGNLANNAARFTTRGSVELELSATTDDRDGVRIARLVFTVTDTGPGIDARDRARIFEPFAQVDRATEGTGLGLSVVRDLVAALGGTVALASEPGLGSRFTVTLDAPVIDGGPSAARSRPRPGRRVLVVDDDATNRLVARRLLARLGLDADEVADGPSALERLRAGGYDAVLLDHQMPGMDGLEVARAIRLDEPPGHRTPIIALTGSALAADRRRCLDAGMDDHLAKPVSLDLLGECLGRWIGTDGECDDATTEPAPASGEILAIDVACLDALAGDLGDPDVVTELVRSFLADLPERLFEFSSAAAAGDRNRAKRQAHTIKSTARMLGAHDLGALAADTERLAAGPDADLMPAAAELCAAADVTRRSFEIWMANAP